MRGAVVSPLPVRNAQRNHGFWWVLALAGVLSCGGGQALAPTCPDAEKATKVETLGAGPVTVANAEAFMAEVDKDLRRLFVARERAGWVQKNFITDDTQEIATDTEQAVMEYLSKTIKLAMRFDKLDMPPDLRRK